MKTCYYFFLLAFFASTVVTQMSGNRESVHVPCIQDKDCSENGGKCVNNECKCVGNCQLPLDETVVTRIGAPCLALRECNVEGSYCLSNTCTCKSGSIASENGKKCLKISQEIGSACVESIQCSAKIASSVCTNHVCACAENMHLHENICIANKTLGDDCNVSDECTTEYSECDGECRCIKRYIRSGKKCLLAGKSIMSPCTEDIQCEHTMGTGSMCVQGLCQCRELYQYDSDANKCVRDLLLGEVCSEDHSECHQPNSDANRLECIYGVCKCRYPFVEEANYCVSSAHRFHVYFIIQLVAFIIHAGAAR